ncbi:MAG TPA: MerR family transcriptional regulator [Bryobacteraceae bacterium]|nr:MerR family transcriptional regulator [Bryobacteraceae bacterium]
MYQARQFAELAGVTVRTLHHYDRVGLLKPRRTRAGYRIYQARDLERLEQVVALKFLGLPLKQIRSLLDREALPLPDALRRQRRVLEDKRQLLDRAIRAIQEAEASLRSGKAADTALLTKIIEVIEMQSNTDWLAKYQNPAAKSKIAARQGEWTPELQAQVSKQWTELFADVEKVLDEDPASPKVQALAERWMRLVEAFTKGDPDVTQSVTSAWKDFDNWPEEAKQHAAPFSNQAVCSFMQKAIALRKK